MFRYCTVHPCLHSRRGASFDPSLGRPMAPNMSLLWHAGDLNDASRLPGSACVPGVKVHKGLAARSSSFFSSVSSPPYHSLLRFVGLMASCLARYFAFLLVLQSALASPIAWWPWKSNTRKPGYTGAVASESSICSQIGTDLLKMGGNAADAMVGTVACVGTVSMYHSGVFILLPELFVL